MGYGIAVNEKHFTGKKKNPARSKKKRVIRAKKKQHINKYRKGQ